MDVIDASRRSQHPALLELAEFDLPAQDSALFGSGPLLARGWIDEVGDLDILVRREAWSVAQERGTLTHLEQYDVDIVTFGTFVTAGPTWGLGTFDVDQLIDTAEMVNGVRCVRLEHVIEYKQLAGRPKDLIHLAIIERHLSGNDR